MTNTMPLSPVANGEREVNPEWRRYLARTGEVVGKIQDLLASTDETSDIALVKARIVALQNRIASLPAIAKNPVEKLMIWRGTNSATGTDQTFEHNLDTPHIWWQLRVLSNGVIPIDAIDHRVINQDNFSVRLELSASYNPGEVEAVIIGVISAKF